MADANIMLSEAKNYLRELHQENKLYVYGQNFNPRSYAIAASDMLMKGYEDSINQQAIGLLHERRTALIAAAVTGQINITG